MLPLRFEQSTDQKEVILRHEAGMRHAINKPATCELTAAHCPQTKTYQDSSSHIKNIAPILGNAVPRIIHIKSPFLIPLQLYK